MSCVYDGGRRSNRKARQDFVELIVIPYRQATPMTYEWNGKQFVVIAAGGYAKSGTRLGDYLVAFALQE